MWHILIWEGLLVIVMLLYSDIAWAKIGTSSSDENILHCGSHTDLFNLNVSIWARCHDFHAVSVYWIILTAAWSNLVHVKALTSKLDLLVETRRLFELSFLDESSWLFQYTLNFWRIFTAGRITDCTIFFSSFFSDLFPYFLDAC